MLECPLLLGFFVHHFSALDINTTHSTWLELMALMSEGDFCTRRLRKHINRFLTDFRETEAWGTYQHISTIVFVIFPFLLQYFFIKPFKQYGYI
ncbi:MAG: hypothetical protein SCJ97_07010 [Bacillota bacterium]|nr:hypothetical protein [Bacillota bacterium]